MRRRLFIRSLLVLILVLIPATPALANGLASWVWIWPGVVSIQPLFGLLPTVLVSFLERPFVSRAGVDKRPMVRSIRANLLSLLAGIPVSFFVGSVRSMQGLILLAVVAVAITIAVEIAYFRWVLQKESRQLRWLWIVFGNIVSNLVLVGIAMTVKILGEKHPELEFTLVPYQAFFVFMHVAISLTALIAALFEPAMRLLSFSVAVEQGGTSRSDTMANAAAGDMEPNESGRIRAI